MPDQRNDARTQQRQQDTTGQTPSGSSSARRHDSDDSGIRRELYSALMDGFGPAEQADLDRAITGNVERLRDTGDGYAP